jgi:hypothetical protein
MKTKPFPFITAALTAALVSPAFALEAPADDAPPPPVTSQPQGPMDDPGPRPLKPNDIALPEIKLPAPGEPAVRNKAVNETAFLGVVSGDIPDMLADHLGLKFGGGVVVRSLVPDGPAAKAGVAMHDVITKVNGQAVGSPAEISKEVSSHKPGEKVTVDLIHKGKPATLDVTLGVKPAEMADAELRTLDQLDLEGFPKELADRLRDAIEGNIGGIDLKDPDLAAPQAEEALRDLQKRMRGAVAGGFFNQPDDAPGKAKAQSSATIKMQDQLGSVEVKAKDGAKGVTVRDKQGNVTWSGPWDTAQDKAAAPAEVRARVDALNIDSSFQGPGLRLQMRQAQPDILPGNDR